MDTAARKQLLDALEQIGQEQPEWRFGQLVAHLAVFARGPFQSATADVDDAELLEAATRHLHNLEERRRAKAEVKEMIAAMGEKRQSKEAVSVT